MHARISTWRARPDDLELILRDVAPTVSEIQLQPGYVAGYEIQVAPDTRMVVSIWQDEAQLQAASEKIASMMRPLVEGGRVELVDVRNGPAEAWRTTDTTTGV